MESIKKVIYSFFSEMNKWEKICNQIDNNRDLSFEEKELKQKELVTKIVDKFLTKKERKMGLPNNISYGHEGSYTYDPNEEEIISIEIEKNKAIVTTQREKPIKDANKYILKKIQGTWLIDSKKNYTWEKKWANAIL